MTSKEWRHPAAMELAKVAAGCRHSLMRVAVFAAALAFTFAQSSAQEKKPEKVKLPDDVEKAFAAFIKTAHEARKPVAKEELTKLCDEVAKSVKLTDEQRKKLESEATGAVEETCAKFSEKLDAWLRPFLVGYGDKALSNLDRWKPEQFATRPNVSASPQDEKSWEAAVKRVLTPEQFGVYQREVGDKTVRRKKEIATYLKDALIMRRKQLEDAFKLEREGIVREFALDKDRAAKLEATEKTAVTGIIAEDEKAAVEQLLAMSDDSWQQMFRSGGSHQFDGSGKPSMTRREPWKKALGEVLKPEELTRWDGMLARRQESRDRAATMGAVAELEDRVLLSAEQRIKLEKVFQERWKRYTNNENMQIHPQNLLRSGSDSEVKSILSPEQLKVWEAAFNRGSSPKPANGAPDKPPAVPAPLVDAEKIFSSHLTNTYHRQRDRSVAEMQGRVDEIVRVTGLSGDGLKLLKVAALGAVERVLDAAWKSNVDSNVRRSVDGVAPQFIQQRLEAMGDNTSYNFTSPREHALWKDTIAAVLTPEQRQAYDKVLAERETYLTQAIIHLTLAQLDTSLRLSGGQRERLEPLLVAIVKDYWPDYRKTFSGNSYAIYPYYLPVLLAGVPEADRKNILTPEQLKQFKDDSENRFGNWWDNMKRMHDERVKAEKK